MLTVVTGPKMGNRLRVVRENLLSHGFVANEQMFKLDFGVRL